MLVCFACICALCSSALTSKRKREHTSLKVFLVEIFDVFAIYNVVFSTGEIINVRRSESEAKEGL